MAEWASLQQFLQPGLFWQNLKHSALSFREGEKKNEHEWNTI